jgi:ferredoxin
MRRHGARAGCGERLVMSSAAGLPSLLDGLEARARSILDACTACGDCVRACPTPHAAGVDVGRPEDVARGVLDLLRSGDGSCEARRWAADCCGTGNCLAACKRGIDPRFMLVMARRAMALSTPDGERRAAGRKAFEAMTRGVRVLSRLQLPPELLERLAPSSQPEREGGPDLGFYTGCNLLKTPHIGLLCVDVLDRLGVSYEVHGGPASCCGILQMRPGDTANAARQAARTIERFAGTGASEILAWCPTCQIQLGETMLPGLESSRRPSFDMTMFPVYLARRLEALAPLMTAAVPKRVALFEFPGATGVSEAVRRVLGAIPQLELVDLGLEGIGYQITSLAAIPGHRRELLGRLLREAEGHGVDTLAGIFHADHRELAAHQPEWPFEIVNYMELVGESLGICRQDTFKRLKLMRDVDQIVAASRDLIDAHALDLEEVREVVLRDLLGEQHLATDRTRHQILGR